MSLIHDSDIPAEPPQGQPQSSHPSHRGRISRRGLAITAVVALAAGAAAGAGVLQNSATTSTATATSKTVLSTAQIASAVSPGLVDVVSTLGYQSGTAAGTGIVLTSTGEILTNNHVIDGASSIRVTDIGNGGTYQATVVGYDKSQDIAVLQLQGASGLKTASLGNSSTVQTAQQVVALGNAGGKGGTPAVAAGQVTALNQSITASDEGSGSSEQLSGLIETNANIQPGDSGGSLVNSYAQVIGIDTAASSGSATQTQAQSQSQSYAIPINEAVSIADQIEAGTSTATVHIGATAFLGVQVESSGSSAGGTSGGVFGGQSTGGQSTTGATVAGTLSGSPAASAGLAAGDEIVSLGGQSISSPTQITTVLEGYHPGSKISVSWLNQSGQTQTATVVLATGPAA
jgi:S1-C subfamily serine protease